LNQQPDRPGSEQPAVDNQVRHTRVNRAGWLVTALVSLLLLHSLTTLWLWWHSGLLADMQRNTQMQLFYSANLQRAASDTSRSDATLQQFRDDARLLWSAHWENANGRYQGLQNLPGTKIKSTYQETRGSLSDNIRRLVERIEKPGFSIDADTSSSLTQVRTQLTDVAERLHEAERRFRGVSALLTWFFSAALALAAAAYYVLAIRPLRKAMGNTEGELASTRARLKSISRIDPLTHLPNRRAITEFLSELRNNNQSGEEFIALAILDIDHFGHINDAFGYYAGDAVLQSVGSRVQTELRDDDKLGRLGADHFAIVLRHLASPRDAEKIIHRIQQRVSQPVDYKDSPLAVSCTVGASVQQMETLDLAELFKVADQALLRAKQNHRGSLLLLSDQAQAAISRQRAIINRMKYHPPEEIFTLAYQPIVSLADNEIVGVECLLRWRDQAPSDLHPDEFVPVLEMFGEINRTGDWILHESLSHLKSWQQIHPARPLFMSINVSTLQLESEDYAQKVIALVETLGIDPVGVALELTESIAMKHQDSGRRQLAMLRNKGFGISLDDFGTGYSSLQYLKTMPVSTVKIDKSFINDLLSDERDAAIVESTIRISASMGLTAVAEGIENRHQADRLATMGCHYGQGYFFSPPVAAAQFEAMLGIRSALPKRSSG
jgi:diguanylate cyclase (GGDEF)-like protein